MIVYNGLKLHGLGYVRHFFMGPFPINILIAFLEMIGVVVKCFALAIRLFANMVAGHILLAILVGFIGMAGAAIGVGNIFGSFLSGALRNPSAAQSQFGNLIFGFAVTEALGIFSFLIALLLLFAV